MPTTESSNNPHVRITRECHEDLRKLSAYTGISQGELVDDMTLERLERLGNPHLTMVLPPRQRRASTTRAKASASPRGSRGHSPAAATRTAGKK
jgi:hypothetical protein